MLKLSKSRDKFIGLTVLIILVLLATSYFTFELVAGKKENRSLTNNKSEKTTTTKHGFINYDSSTTTADTVKNPDTPPITTTTRYTPITTTTRYVPPTYATTTTIDANQAKKKLYYMQVLAALAYENGKYGDSPSRINNISSGITSYLTYNGGKLYKATSYDLNYGTTYFSFMGDQVSTINNSSIANFYCSYYSGGSINQCSNYGTFGTFYFSFNGTLIDNVNSYTTGVKSYVYYNQSGSDYYIDYANNISYGKFYIYN